MTPDELTGVTTSHRKPGAIHSVVPTDEMFSLRCW
jgi:hypothetical protein